MTINRRTLLQTSAAAALASLPPVPAHAAGDAATLNTLFDTIFQEGLRQNPQFATNIGLDKGPNADLAYDYMGSGIASLAAHVGLATQAHPSLLQPLR